MSNTAANVVRWTPTRIAKAMLCPKPKDAVAKAMAYEHGTLARWSFVPDQERRLLDFIASHADLLDLPAPHGTSWPGPVAWLLVPAPLWLLEGLAQVGADREDLETTEDAEPDQDGEAGSDDEPDQDGGDNGDDEPSAGWACWAPDWQPYHLCPPSESTQQAEQLIKLVPASGP